jgi:hypothetical protein
MPFQKGQSGNPGGRPKVLKDVQEVARSYTAEAMEKAAHLMRNAKSEMVQAKALEILLDRGWGKPPQHQHITGENAPVYVARLPEPCKTADEWLASVGRAALSSTKNGSTAINET